MQNSVKKSFLYRGFFLSSLALSFAIAGNGQQGQQGGGGNANAGNIGNLPSGDVVLVGDGSFPLAEVQTAVTKLKTVNLEEVENYTFELSGQTSVNLKFDREGGTDGGFVTRNSAANPNTEVSYYNLASILGIDQIVRGAIPYTLGPRGIATFRSLIANTQFRGMRSRNATTILQATSENPRELKGCLREKKKGEDVAMNSLVDVSNNRPQLAHMLFKDINAANPVPTEGTYNFREGYTANRLKVAQQYSNLMTLDAVFGQWDRYSGGNVVFRIVDDVSKEVEVYSTDNGGADFWNTTKWAEKQVSWFSRYDRKTIEQLKGLYAFLSGRATSLTSERLDKTWTDPKVFVVDLGLYYERRPEQYVRELTNNLAVLLKAVESNYARYGEAIFF